MRGIEGEREREEREKREREKKRRDGEGEGESDTRRECTLTASIHGACIANVFTHGTGMANLRKLSELLYHATERGGSL